MKNWAFLPNFEVVNNKAKITTWNLNNVPLEFNCPNIISEIQYDNWVGHESSVNSIIGTDFKIEEYTPAPTPTPTPTPVQLTSGQYVCLRDWSTQNNCSLSWNRDAILTLMGITDSTNYKWKIQFQFPQYTNGEFGGLQEWNDYSNVNVSNNTANWSHEPFTAILRICLLNDLIKLWI